MARVLTAEELSRIAKLAKNQALKEATTHKHIKWFSDEEKRHIKLAAELGKDGTDIRVKLRDEWFAIKFHPKSTDHVFIHPLNGFAPCGWITLSKVPDKEESI